MSTDENTRRQLEQDVLREIANIGSGHAATALAALLNREIEQNVPNVTLIPLSDVPNALGGPEKIAVGSMIQVSGDIQGQLFMLLDIPNAQKIISIMSDQEMPPVDPFTIPDYSEFEISILTETTNILGGSYTVAISEMTNMDIRMSTPNLCIDMMGAVLNQVITEMGKNSDYALLFQSELFSDKEHILGDLFLVPDKQSCSILLDALLGPLCEG